MVAAIAKKDLSRLTGSRCRSPSTDSVSEILDTFVPFQIRHKNEPINGYTPHLHVVYRFGVHNPFMKKARGGSSLTRAAACASWAPRGQPLPKTRGCG